MPILPIGNTGKEYYLISFDENGKERPEKDGTLLSTVVRNRLTDPAEKITDVFFASHGWKGDVPAAIDQNDRWMGEMAQSPDRAAFIQAHPEFKALNIGLHWPSLPFGDESLPASTNKVLGEGDETDLETEIDQYASVITDTPRAREAIRTILEAERSGAGGRELPDTVQQAYKRLFAEAKLDRGDDELGAPPGEDHPALDAERIYESTLKSAEGAAAPGAARDVVLGGGLLAKLKGIITAPLQQASFWKMKNRARVVGEGGIHTLLDSLMRAASPDVHFHLMGHSFGCIVVSAAVAGPPGGTPLPRGVDTLFLVQGALSLWSFSPDIPFARGTAGYFNRIFAKGLVRGPIITTRSSFDKAVGKLYPPAADLGNDVVLGGELPKYGGIGSFGAQGLGQLATDGPLQPTTHQYGFQPKRVYNLESSNIIRNGGGFSGAHSVIAHPEVAHVMWQAVAASR
jgi:hypothetical protein